MVFVPESRIVGRKSPFILTLQNPPSKSKQANKQKTQHQKLSPPSSAGPDVAQSSRKV